MTAGPGQGQKVGREGLGGVVEQRICLVTEQLFESHAQKA